MRRAITVLGLVASSWVIAGPAPYYLWQSKTDRVVICLQTSPGIGWELRSAQPYRDLHCRQPAARLERPASMPGLRPSPGR